MPSTNTRRSPSGCRSRMKVLLENLLRTEDGVNVTPRTSMALAQWDAQAEPSREIAFTPSRVLLQDFTGVPAVVDLAAMRDAMSAWAAIRAASTRLQPVDLVIDHSVQVDRLRQPPVRFRRNTDLEYERNLERYAFLRWGQSGAAQLPRRAAGYRHCPPGQSRISRAGRLPRSVRPTPSIPIRWSAPIRTRR